MEDLAQNAAKGTNQNANAIDASGLTQSGTSKGFNANVGKHTSELKGAAKPISTQTDSIKTPQVTKGAEGLKGAKGPEPVSMPEGNRETTGFSDILSKKAQSYMSDKVKGSSSQTPTGETPSPTDKQSSINPKVADGTKGPERPETKMTKPNMNISDTPKQSAPAFKPTPSIQIPKFTLPNFKR